MHGFFFVHTQINWACVVVPFSLCASRGHKIKSSGEVNVVQLMDESHITFVRRTKFNESKLNGIFNIWLYFGLLNCSHAIFLFVRKSQTLVQNKDSVMQLFSTNLDWNIFLSSVIYSWKLMQISVIYASYK